MKFAALFALLLANPAFANGLDDLKNALAPLQGQGALRGTFDVKRNKTDLDSKPKPPENASAAAYVDDDGSGVSIRWDRALLKRAAEESRPVNGLRKAEPLSGLIRSTSAPAVAQALNYAPALLMSLANSALKAERADSWQGKPARLLELIITEANPDEEKIKLKENSTLASIWIGADGIPMAATMTRKVRGSALMFLSFEQTGKEEMSFGLLANRLVVLKRDESGTGKGFGSESQFHNVFTFTPKS